MHAKFKIIFVLFFECNGKNLLNCKTDMSSRNIIVGHSDPVVVKGITIAQRIKGTLGITG